MLCATPSSVSPDARSPHNLSPDALSFQTLGTDGLSENVLYNKKLWSKSLMYDFYQFFIDSVKQFRLQDTIRTKCTRTKGIRTKSALGLRALGIEHTIQKSSYE